MEKYTPADQFVSMQEEGGRAALRLNGVWTIHNAAMIENRIIALSKHPGFDDAPVDAQGIEDIDTSGAWLIRKYFRSNPALRAGDRQKALLEFFT